MDGIKILINHSRKNAYPLSSSKNRDFRGDRGVPNVLCLVSAIYDGAANGNSAVDILCCQKYGFGGIGWFQRQKSN
jgi:hypothetical protein